MGIGDFERWVRWVRRSMKRVLGWVRLGFDEGCKEPDTISLGRVLIILEDESDSKDVWWVWWEVGEEDKV